MNQSLLPPEQPEQPEQPEANEPSLFQDPSAPSTVSPVVLVLPGRLLRNLRESSNLAIADVAQALKFSPRQIEALERDDYASLPGMNFVRGFIRSYARWLKTDPVPLLQLLDDETAAPTPEILAPEHMGAAMPRPRGQSNRLPMLAGLLLIAALAGLAAYYFSVGHWPVLSLPAMNPRQAEPLAAPTPVVTQPVQELPTPAVVSTDAAPPVASSPDVVAAPALVSPAVSSAPVVSAPVASAAAASAPAPASVPTVSAKIPAPAGLIASPAPAVVPAPAAPATAAKPNVPGSGSANVPASIASNAPAVSAPRPKHELVFSFEGKSWVEVRDASGRIVFAQINAPGTQQAVSGKPPFQVVIGNAAQVKLQLDERNIDLVPYIRAEVARLTVE